VAVKKKKAKKKTAVKKKKTAAKKKSSISKKRAPAKKTGKSTKRKTAVKKKSSISKKQAPAKKTKAKTVVKKAALKKAVAKKAAVKKTVEPAEEIIKPFVKSPFKKNDPKILNIQQRLIQERKRLMGMLRSSKEVERNINDINFSNEIDLASSLEGREMAFQLSSRDRNELRKVEKALLKITGNTYGVCDNCSKYIILKRLEIMPLTELCIECQENMEIR